MARSGATVKNSGSGSIGDIRHSMLTESEFQAVNGTNWILADGRNVAGSRYAVLKVATTVPDLRGVQLRGKNNGRADGNQDPAGDRALGNFQGDAFQGHYHELAVGTNAGGGGNGGIISGNTFNRTVNNPVADASNGSPRTASETRVKNVAVNIFIKIN